jgi:hypothetical protein
MKQLVLVSFLIFSFACGNKASEKTTAETTNHPLEKTTVIFDEQAHNFGKLKAGEIVVHTFVFTNSGNNNYQIERVVADCACLNTHFSEEFIKPGEKGKIEVEFNTAGTAGREYKTIEVYGNSKELKHLAIFAEVKNEIISY